MRSVTLINVKINTKTKNVFWMLLSWMLVLLRVTWCLIYQDGLLFKPQLWCKDWAHYMACFIPEPEPAWCSEPATKQHPTIRTHPNSMQNSPTVQLMIILCEQVHQLNKSSFAWITELTLWSEKKGLEMFSLLLPPMRQSSIWSVSIISLVPLDRSDKIVDRCN